MRQIIALHAGKTCCSLSLFLALAIVAGAFPAGAVADHCDTAAGCPASDARSFTESVGINTHLGYSDTAYYKRWDDLIKPRLLELGVSHVRDGTSPAEYPDVIGPTVAARYRELNANGVKGNLLVGAEQRMAGQTTLADRLNWIKSNSLTDWTIGIEGDNEPYIGVDGPDDWDHDAARIDALRAMQCDIWKRVKGDPALASKTVLGPSEGAPTYEDRWYFHVAYNRGTLENCMDRGSLHPYPGEEPPHLRQGRDLDYAVEWAKPVHGQKPSWVTESGYWNKSQDGSHISERAAATYTPRMAFEYFRRGFERTQLYELLDLASSARVIDNYGLLRADGSKKPAFTALANTLAITKDNGAGTGALGYEIACTSGCHSPVRDVMLPRSDGSFLLAVWSESRIWDGNQDTPQRDQNIEVRLAEGGAKVEVLRPAQGTTPIQTFTDGSATVKTVASDDVRLLRITPGAVSIAPSLSGQAEGMTLRQDYSWSSPEPGVVIEDSTSSAGKHLLLWTYGTGTLSMSPKYDYAKVVVRARGDQCAGAPRMRLLIDGIAVAERDVTTSGWADYEFATPVKAGSRRIGVSYLNDYEHSSCNRGLRLDKVTLANGSAPPR